MDNIFEIPLNEIIIKEVNIKPTNTNSQESLHELAESIKINGLLQPIVLRGNYGNPPYDVIVGQRRFLAHQILKEDKIKAVFSGVVDDTKALLLSLSENMCRQELNYAVTAEAITKLYKHFNNDEYEVQKHLGISIRAIRSYIKIEEQASDKIKVLLKESKVSMADAKRAIDASQGNHEKADKLVEQLSKLTKYEKKRVVEIGSSNSEATAEEIIESAKKPKFEETVILNLPLKIHEALIKASTELSEEIEEITLKALTMWLKNNDFLSE